jgi:hypothetical protein
MRDAGYVNGSSGIVDLLDHPVVTDPNTPFDIAFPPELRVVDDSSDHLRW